jgi:hypothetical protein
MVTARAGWPLWESCAIPLSSRTAARIKRRKVATLRTGGRNCAPLAKFRTRRPAHTCETSRYRAGFERPSYVRRWRRTGWLGRQDSNLCIWNGGRLGLPLSCGAKVGSRSCAGLPAGACTICLPSPQGTTAVKPAARKFPMQKSESRHLSQPVRLQRVPPQPASPSPTRHKLTSLKNHAVPRGFADMSWPPCAEFRNGGAIPASCRLHRHDLRGHALRRRASASGRGTGGLAARPHLRTTSAGQPLKIAIPLFVC